MGERSHHGPRILAELGIRIGQMPSGKLGGLTDVAGVRVGHVTLVRGEPGRPPILRTGVTAILPHSGNLFQEKVEAAVHVINGFGKSVGLPQVEELGEIESPILLTGTLNTWRVADALVDYLSEQNPGLYSFNPIVCECNDSFLSDELARPVGREHVFQAIREGYSGPIAEGCVGAGTGVSGFGFKAGIGTASRMVADKSGVFTVGVLVQTNTGGAGDLRLDGVPVGRMLAASQARSGEAPGSIIIVVATDAPLSSRQLKRVAKRAAFGLARTGAVAAHGSGDFVIAFSTATRRSPAVAERIPEDRLTDFFTATIAATEEAIIRSILCAETTV
ncbi:MAG: P1 family peptidase, partial [Planctomycetes bacterium]|nr:P1 family peptidase [Planctomycetota bacterium]